LQQTIVADFSMKMEGRIEPNGNQEKGKEEKEALRKSVRSQKRGTPKASPKFLCGGERGLTGQCQSSDDQSGDCPLLFV
jgi:hypothetical protein